ERPRHLRSPRVPRADCARQSASPLARSEPHHPPRRGGRRRRRPRLQRAGDGREGWTEKLVAGALQLKTGSATVPVAPVGVPPTGPGEPSAPAKPFLNFWTECF